MQETDSACPCRKLIPRLGINRGRPVIENITVEWLRYFMSEHSIVANAQTCKLSTSPEKKLVIEKNVACNLGKLKRGFVNKIFSKDNIGNADQTHFNMDNDSTLDLKGRQNSNTWNYS